MYHIKNADIHELYELVIPNCLLEAAELSENCDLDIQCVPGAIIIGGIDPIAIVPPALMELFDDLGISHAAIRNGWKRPRADTKGNACSYRYGLWG